MRVNLFGESLGAPPLGQISKANTIEWGTPKELFKDLDEKFHFTLDPCSSELNHKCDKYYTKESNGLIQDWSGEVVFCNPPYGREIYDWAAKCYYEWKEHNVTIVMLLPARTDTRWFHDFIYHQAEIEFLKGRLAFECEKGNSQKAPFPSMIAIFKAKETAND